MFWTEYVLGFAVFLFVLYKYGTRNRNFWKKRGVKQTDPLVPFLGDSYPAFFKMMDPIQMTLHVYNFFKEERFGGCYFFEIPFLIIRDPELLRLILVKDSEHFLNRYDWANESDPLMRKNLTALKGEKWRNMRMVMTSVFTSAKMKDMFIFMQKCAQQSADNIKRSLESQMERKVPNSDVLELEIKEYFSRYGTDVIASTAFGVEIDSFKNPDNEFMEAGQLIQNGFSGLNLLKMTFIMVFPKVAKVLGLTFFGKKLNDFLMNTVSENIRYREKHNIVRRDMIHLFMEARKGKNLEDADNLVKGKLPDLTDEDIAAQAVLFFFGGFETMATLLGFACHELAVNTEAQEKLHEEIDRFDQSEDGITYDTVMHQMQYLDMVINETLRKWPPAVMTDRQVTKQYTIPKTENSPEIVLQEGDKLWISIAAIQRDPKYFPDPEKFDPERFRDEKNTIKPYTFLAFGAGIRHCVGMRYALMEAKTALVYLLRNFEIVPTKKTEIPIKLVKSNAFILRPQNGFHLGLKLRKSH